MTRSDLHWAVTTLSQYACYIAAICCYPDGTRSLALVGLGTLLLLVGIIFSPNSPKP